MQFLQDLYNEVEQETAKNSLYIFEKALQILADLKKPRNIQVAEKARISFYDLCAKGKKLWDYLDYKKYYNMAKKHARHYDKPWPTDKFNENLLSNLRQDYLDTNCAQFCAFCIDIKKLGNKIYLQL